MRPNRRSVDARVPLALLEAMQQQDTPAELLPDEHSGSLFPNRLGLSGVVEEQMRQFHRLARLHRRVEEEQVEALLELISRRRDAAAVFASAGRGLARRHFAGLAGSLRRIPLHLPSPLRRRAAVRVLRTANGAFLIASAVTVDREPLEVRARDALTARVTGAGSACQIYSSLTSALLDMSGAGPVRIVHSECQGRGDRRCVWQVLPEEPSQG